MLEKHPYALTLSYYDLGDPLRPVMSLLCPVTSLCVSMGGSGHTLQLYPHGSQNSNFSINMNINALCFVSAS